MKKNNIVLFGIAVLCACSVPKERQPLTGGQWGEIKNGSAEEVVSSEVLYWQAPPASKEVLHFYDATAHDGTRSLCISADGLANGYWNNRVNLKPWSKYRFKGWIKCENVVAEPQGGAGFRLQGVEVQLPDFTGKIRQLYLDSLQAESGSPLRFGHYIFTFDPPFEAIFRPRFEIHPVIPVSISQTVG